ncbi:hypothetical protein [Mesobacillus harenae]|uniref:hypothetical protein n=1 Tax=Mesobacillus harenae TaxID=2213203 RepID=UPI0018D6F5F4|nr:hypothetical protein [Mesobacillus harenae]
MGIIIGARFAEFKEKISKLTLPIHENELLSENFLLEESAELPLDIYYAPVDYFNDHAKILMVGITPGLNQMKKSYSAVRERLALGLSDEELLHMAKKESSYEGTMRKNLVTMLDQLGLPAYLNIKTSMELFSSANHLVHTTGVLPYPVFFNGKNFNGSRPDMLKNDLLRQYILKHFAPSLQRMEEPLIIPLGIKTAAVLNYLLKRNYLKATTILRGFPHPSGGNGHRHKQFAANKEDMAEQIKCYFSNH